jgi:hypothetical protein
MNGKRDAKALKDLESLVDSLRTNEEGGTCECFICTSFSFCTEIFREPVDVKKLNLPQYLEIIKHPMDLGTIKVTLFSHDEW